MARAAEAATEDARVSTGEKSISEAESSEIKEGNTVQCNCSDHPVKLMMFKRGTTD